MAPSASLQSRISAFESLQLDNNNTQPKLNGGVRLAPLSLPRKPQLQQHFLDSDSTSPTADALCSIPPIHPDPTSSRPSSPAALGRKSSLIDFSELASPKDIPVSVDGTGSTTGSTSTLNPSKKPQLPPRTAQLPPLPPRKPSIPSSTTRLPLPKRHASSPVFLAESTIPSNTSLLNAPDTHTYPPGSPRRGPSPVFQTRHMPSSSTSSFHSVSLSSDGGDTRESLDGSYEAVSSTAATSPTISTLHDWEHDSKSTPKLPQRQWQKNSISPPTSPAINSSTATIRRPPPPPPPRISIKPQALQRHRSTPLPTPLPLNVRRRYDALFERNLPPNPRKGRTSGWRGLSVDLLTNGEKSEFIDDFSREDRLDGRVVKSIWCCSKLPRAQLREIWLECDPAGLGYLDRDAFAKGMSRIDEELSRAHQDSLKRAPLLSSRPIPPSFAPRVPPPPLRKPSFLLR